MWCNFYELVRTAEKQTTKEDALSDCSWDLWIFDMSCKSEELISTHIFIIICIILNQHIGNTNFITLQTRRLFSNDILFPPFRKKGHFCMRNMWALLLHAYYETRDTERFFYDKIAELHSNSFHSIRYMLCWFPGFLHLIRWIEERIKQQNWHHTLYTHIPVYICI